MQHIRLISFLLLLTAVDHTLLRYALDKTLAYGVSIHLLFAFEYAVQGSTAVATIGKYILSGIDLLSHGGWEGKGVAMFYLGLTLDLLHLITYSAFFAAVFSTYGIPIHLVRDLYWTFRNFHVRVRDFLRYRRVTADMERRFPNATSEDLARADHTCIICREDMPEGSHSKKLDCNHVFHMKCLRSWLERQQNCPVCRSPVVADRDRGVERRRPMAERGSAADGRVDRRNDALQNASIGGEARERPLGDERRSRVGNLDGGRRDGPIQSTTSTSSHARRHDPESAAGVREDDYNRNSHREEQSSSGSDRRRSPPPPPLLPQTAVIVPSLPYPVHGQQDLSGAAMIQPPSFSFTQTFPGTYMMQPQLLRNVNDDDDDRSEVRDSRSSMPWPQNHQATGGWPMIAVPLLITPPLPSIPASLQSLNQSSDESSSSRGTGEAMQHQQGPFSTEQRPTMEEHAIASTIAAAAATAAVSAAMMQFPDLFYVTDANNDPKSDGGGSADGGKLSRAEDAAEAVTGRVGVESSSNASSSMNVGNRDEQDAHIKADVSSSSVLARPDSPPVGAESSCDPKNAANKDGKSIEPSEEGQSGVGKSIVEPSMEDPKKVDGDNDEDTMANKLPKDSDVGENSDHPKGKAKMSDDIEEIRRRRLERFAS